MHRRIAVTLSLLAMSACGVAAPDAGERSLDSGTVDGSRAPVTAFVPPTPPGCAGATAYDACFALEDATPFAVRVGLPVEARANAVAVVRFHRASGVREQLDLDELRFTARHAPELRLYFQVDPGEYRVEVRVDADGDGDPDGPGDLVGWSALSPDVAVLDENGAAIVAVAAAPIETAFRVALRR
jgi:hypothetical protein